MRIVRRAAARVVCLAADRWVLLLRWRDPLSGAEMWEPPGGGVERGESPVEAARRELLEEAGLSVSGVLRGPVVVPRDFVWNGSRRVVDEPFFLASWDAIPSVRPESDPALVGFAWVRVDAVAGLDVVEPESLVEVLSRLRTARPTPRSR